MARRCAALTALGLALWLLGCSTLTRAARPIRGGGPAHWIAAWAASPEPPGGRDLSAVRGLPAHVTLRQVVLLSADGTSVRVHLSDRFGGGVAIAAARVGAAAPGGGLSGRATVVRFAGRPTVAIPAGADVTSDPVPLRVHRLEHLAVSLYFAAPTGPATYHGAAEEHAYVGRGDQVAATGTGWIATRPTDWYLLDGIDTRSAAGYRGTVVAFGDSITAGVASRVDGFGAWPDDLIRRLAARGGPATVGVVDAGITGNRLLSTAPCCGPAALARFGPDALGQAGVRTVILLEGTNDLGFGAAAARAAHRAALDVSAAQLIGADERIIARARRAGARVIGATLLPFRGAFYWSPAAEAQREQLNHWILTGGAFAATIDFAALMAAPGDRSRLRPAYDSGDHLHPDDAGYRAMAQAVDLGSLLALSG